MSQSITAIYENGVLKPLHPVDLKEHAIVSLAVVGEGDESSGKPAEVLASQKNALASMLEETALLAREGAEDELSNRDHDLILYGWKK